MVLISANNLAKLFCNSYHEHTASLIDYNIEIETGSFVVITGKVDYGKSTLLHLLGGYDCPKSGKICIKDMNNSWNNSCMSDNDLAELYQDEMRVISKEDKLISELTVYENIMIQSLISGNKVKNEYMKMIESNLYVQKFLHRYPKCLSDEMKHYVIILRALANQPRIIVSDDPFSHRNIPLCYEILDLLLEYYHTHQCTLVLVTEKPEISVFANRVIRMTHGKIVEDSISQLKTISCV